MDAQGPRLLDRVRDAIRTRHDSRRTEAAYVTWIRQYIVFHRKAHPGTLGASDISAFLTWLATTRRVSASTQNQALAALLFLYEHVLCMSIGPVEHVVRAKQPDRLPVVLSRDEVGLVLSRLDGTLWIIGMLLYGAGLRLEECLKLRVKDLDFDRQQIAVRRGKGQKDRTTMLPGAVVEPLRRHLVDVRRVHEADLQEGSGESCCLTRSTESIRTQLWNGDGSLCFRPGGSAAIRAGARPPGFTCTSRWCRRRLRERSGGRRWRSESAHIGFGTHLPRISWRTATTSARFKSCSGIGTSARRWCTRMCYSVGRWRCGVRRIGWRAGRPAVSRVDVAVQ